MLSAPQKWNDLKPFMKDAIKAQAAIGKPAPTIPHRICAFHVCPGAMRNNVLSGQQMSAIHGEFPSLLSLNSIHFQFNLFILKHTSWMFVNFYSFYLVCTSNLFEMKHFVWWQSLKSAILPIGMHWGEPLGKLSHFWGTHIWVARPQAFMLCKTPQCSALSKTQKGNTALKSRVLIGKCFSGLVWKAGFSAQFSSWLPM